MTPITNTLKIMLLGSPQILFASGVPIAPLEPKALTLFFFLVTTGRAHTREEVADLLWDEQGNPQARNNLRYLLSDLRKVLGHHLTVTPQTLAFRRHTHDWLDLEIFRAIVSRKQEELNPQTLQRAMELYRGEFLAGVSVRNAPRFEEWVKGQRQTWRTLAVQGFYSLATCYIEEGNMNAGLMAIHRLLAEEPLHEAGYRLQMKVLAATGQRVAAITLYHKLCKLLLNQHHLTPEPETIALYDSLIQ